MAVEIEAEFQRISGIALTECKTVLDSLNYEDIDNLICEILISNKVYFVGVGRVQLSMMAISMRFTHLGLNSFFVGQLVEPPLMCNDLLIVGSGSGESLFPIAIARKANDLGAKVAYLGSNSNSTLAELSTLFVEFPVSTKLHPYSRIKSQQLLTSLFEQSLLMFGDILAKILCDRLGCTDEDLWGRHANLQ